MTSRREVIAVVREGVLRWPPGYRRAVALRRLEQAEAALTDETAVPLIQEAHDMLKQWRAELVYRIRHGG